MPQDFDGRIRVFQTGQTTHSIINADADVGSLSVGGTGRRGILSMIDQMGGQTVAIDGETGRVDFWNAAIDGKNATGRFGGEGQSGTLLVGDSAGQMTVTVEGDAALLSVGGLGKPGSIRIADNQQQETVTIEATGAAMRMGGQGHGASVTMRNASGAATVEMRADDGALDLGGQGRAGALRLRDNGARETVEIDAMGARVRIGAPGHSASLILRDRQGAQTIGLSADRARLTMGGNGVNGRVGLFDDRGEEVVELDATLGRLAAGRSGKAGSLVLRDAQSQGTVRMLADRARIAVGRAGGPGGDLRLQSPAGGEAVRAGAVNVAAVQYRRGQAVLLPGRVPGNALAVGDWQRPSMFQLRNDARQDHITSVAQRMTQAEAGALVSNPPRNGAAGMTFIRGLLTVDGVLTTFDSSKDVAESFPLADGAEGAPGAVMVIGPDGALSECTHQYDRRVLGIVSGAGDLEPGLVLGGALARPDLRLEDDGEDPMEDGSDETGEGPEGAEERRQAAISLAGTVYCQADARFGAIEPGDLLTTSATPGHAMKAIHPNEATGAILGKALDPLESGQGLIRVLVMQA